MKRLRILLLFPGRDADISQDRSPILFDWSVNKPYLQSYTLWLRKALSWPTINIAVDARLAQSRPLDLEFKTD